MSTADAYRRHAAECVQLARLVEKTEDKALLMEMATIWHRLAERLEVLAKQEEN